MDTDIRFEIHGYEYAPWKDLDVDHSVIYHDFITPTGATVSCDWSSYDYMTYHQASTWIDLGMPSRIGAGPLNDSDLLTLARNQYSKTL